MATFNIDFGQFAPSSKKPKLTPAPSSTPMPGKLDISQPRPATVTSTPKAPVQMQSKPVPVSSPAPVQMQSKPASPNTSFIGRVFDLLNKPSELTEKFITGGQGYEKQLENPDVRRMAAGRSPIKIPGIPDLDFGAQLKEKALETPQGRSVAGFLSRMILDPLNIVPVGKIAGVVGKVGSKVDDVARISKTINKSEPIVNAINKVKDVVGTKFVRGYGLPEGYNIAKSEIPTQLGQGAERIVGNIKNLFKGLDQETIEAAAKFLEPKFAGAGTDLGQLRKSLGSKFNDLRPVLSEVRKTLDNEVIDLVKRGRLPGEQAKALLTQGGYFPHTDFATKSLKEILIPSKFGEKRSYLFRRKGSEGFTFNTPKAVAQRELSQFQDNVVQDFLTTIKNSFGVTIGKGQAVPEGFVPFLSESPRLQELRGFALPKKIADDLNASFAPAGGLGKAIDSFNRFWKPTATAVNPGFHLTNIMGNMYNSWIGGMKDPVRFLQGIKGGFSPEEKAIIDKVGILARGQFGGDIVARTFDNPNGINQIRIFEPFRKFGEVLENNARTAFFLDAREEFLAKGLSEAEAVRKAVAKTNQYLFDYLTGLTPFETNVMRRVFPFYTWSRFNIPLQLKTLVTQPEKVAFVSKLTREFNKGGYPEGELEGISIATPFIDSKGNPIRWKPGLPVQDIFNLSPSRIIDQVNPLFKTGASIATAVASKGKQPIVDTYTGRPFSDPNLPVQEQLKDYGSKLPVSLFRPLRTFQKIDQDPSFGNILRSTLVTGTYSVDAKSRQMQKVYEKRAKNEAVRDKIMQIFSDRTKTLSQKQQEAERLLQYLQ